VGDAGGGVGVGDERGVAVGCGGGELWIAASVATRTSTSLLANGALLCAMFIHARKMPGEESAVSVILKVTSLPGATA